MPPEGTITLQESLKTGKRILHNDDDLTQTWVPILGHLDWGWAWGSGKESNPAAGQRGN